MVELNPTSNDSSIPCILTYPLEKKTLIFDLDETLIHCNQSQNEGKPDVSLPIRFPNGALIQVIINCHLGPGQAQARERCCVYPHQAGINVRPYAIECLKELSQYFEIIVFTASHSCYANVVLDYLDPNKQYISHRLFRESCIKTKEGVYVKDLRIFANRSLKDIIIIDNAAYSFAFQLNNGIPIVPFYNDKSDNELRAMIPYLKSISRVKDVT